MRFWTKTVGSHLKWKHVLKTSPRFTAPRESFAVEFVVIKHFGGKSLNVEPSCGLDVEEYMLKSVFCWQIPLEIEFKRRV